MALFSFTLDSFQITDTRSLHEDTDYVTFTLVVNPQNGVGTPRSQTKKMGDVNNGVHTVNLSFANVQVNLTDTVMMNYLIVNSGHKDPSQVVSTLESAGTKLLSAGATAVGGLLPIPELGPALGAVANWLGGQLVSIINANCDGPVAAEQDKFTFNDLMTRTAHGPFSQTTKHAGTNSPTGCGRNSAYIVNWHMLEVGSSANKTVPNVLQISAAQAAQRVQAAGLVAKFSGQNGSQSWVFSQSPTAGHVVDTGSTVNMVLHTGPRP